MRIEMHPGPGTRYRSVITRQDGAVVELLGGSWNRIGGDVGRVPHDLAHLVVESELGLDRGLWGVLDGGGLVQNARVVGGRRPPHGERRSRAVLDAAGESLRQAEVLVRAVADASVDPALRDVDRLRRQVGDRWWCAACTSASLERMDAALRSEAVAWAGRADGEALVRSWPRPRPDGDRGPGRTR